MHKRNPSTNSKKGFTLIELMIVIGVIAILASIILPSVKAAKIRAQRTACQENLKTIATAYHMFRADGSDGSAYIGPLVLIPKYMPRMPVCPCGAGSYDGGATKIGDNWTEMFYCNWSHGAKGVSTDKVTHYSQGLYWTELTGMVIPNY